MKKKARSYPVAPNSVYVWRGFKSASMTYVQFAQFLGTVFVPACALLQPPVGLRAYLPSMVPQANKPAAVPDQTALMFWMVPASHDAAQEAIAARIYTNLHGDVYDMTRSKLPEVPSFIVSVSGALQPEQPYFLLDNPADWMQGAVCHFVGARLENIAVNDFLSKAATWAQAFRQTPPKGVDAALLCCGNDYAVAWVHAPRKVPNLQSVFDQLAQLATPVLRDDAQPQPLNAGLWDDWPGLDLSQHACLNIQFNRIPVAKPRKRGKA